MPKYASGKRALAISDRSGLQYPWREMVTEWNGAFVHVSEYEPKQPQLEPLPISADGVALPQVRPARTAPAVARIMPDNPFETYAAASGIINVTFPGHGLTDRDTYRFRGASQATTASGGTFQFANPQGFDGITGAKLALAAGYSITTGIFRSGVRIETDYAKANYFYFTVNTDTATLGNQKGGGVGCSVGPITLEA